MRIDEVQTTNVNDEAVKRLVKRYLHYYHALMQEAEETLAELNEKHPSTKDKSIPLLAGNEPWNWKEIKFDYSTAVYDDLRKKLMELGSMEEPIHGMIVWKKASNYEEIIRYINALQKTMQLLYPEEKI